MMAVMLLSIAVWIKATKVRLEKERKQTYVVRVLVLASL